MTEGLKEQGLKEYELVYIISPRVAADTVAAVIDRVSALISDGGGEVLSTDNWGRRRLAYPIKRYFEGTYVVNTLRMTPAQAKPLESALEISEEVLRHLLTNGIVPPTPRSRDRRDDDRERSSFGTVESAGESSERPAAVAAESMEPAMAATAAAPVSVAPGGAASDSVNTADAAAAPVLDASRDEAPEPAAAALAAD